MFSALMVPGELGKSWGFSPSIKLSCGLSCDTPRVAELLPYNDELTAMTWPYSEILAYTQSLTGS